MQFSVTVTDFVHYLELYLCFSKHNLFISSLPHQPFRDTPKNALFFVNAVILLN
jgi:hypothetical protein